MLSHEKVVLTPRTVARTFEAMSRMAVMAAEGDLQVLDGENLLNVILKYTLRYAIYRYFRDIWVSDRLK